MTSDLSTSEDTSNNGGTVGSDADRRRCFERPEIPMEAAS